jgi:putative nucleotidyltransferase with HDIG domain
VALQVAAVTSLAFILLHASAPILLALVVILLYAAGVLLLLAGGRDAARSRLSQDQMEIQFTTVKTMVLALEARHPSTEGHSLRVRALARRILNYLSLEPAARRAVEMAAVLHDAGKVGVPESLLTSPARLLPEETERARKHVEIGVELLGALPALSEVAELVRSHHERFDGGGYPRGLSGEEIPLGARIIAVADAVDAMRSGRPYQAPLSIEETIRELHAGRGGQFDPRIADIAIGLLESRAAETAASGGVRDGGAAVTLTAAGKAEEPEMTEKAEKEEPVELVCG